MNLAHVSHWELGYSTGQYVVDAIFGDPRLPESRAVGVEWQITNDIYSGNGTYNDWYQGRTISQITDLDEGYTSLVIDLIDDVNQRDDIFSGNSAYPNDQVSGYSLSQIENALPGSLGFWWTWRTKIKDMCSNSSEANVDYLFQTYH